MLLKICKVLGSCKNIFGKHCCFNQGQLKDSCRKINTFCIQKKNSYIKRYLSSSSTRVASENKYLQNQLRPMSNQTH